MLVTLGRWMDRALNTLAWYGRLILKDHFRIGATQGDEIYSC